MYSRSINEALAHALGWVGRLHILIVHFPIALLTAAAAIEFWWLCRRRSAPSPAARFCVVFGALSAVAATALGWLHADWGGFGADSPDVLRWHRWTGTALAAVALGTASLAERDARRQRIGFAYRVFLFTSAALVAAAAHLGGSLVHGSDFLDW